MSGKAANDNGATQPPAKQFDYALGETVCVMLTGRVIERKDGPTGDQYWIEQDLPNGGTARQWFKLRDIYPADEPVAGAA